MTICGIIQTEDEIVFLWTSAPFCGTVVYCKGGTDMSRMTVEEIYRGEKYDVMSAAPADHLMNGRAAEYDERTWLDMLAANN